MMSDKGTIVEKKKQKIKKALNASESGITLLEKNNSTKNSKALKLLKEAQIIFSDELNE